MNTEDRYITIPVPGDEPAAVAGPRKPGVLKRMRQSFSNRRREKPTPGWLRYTLMGLIACVFVGVIALGVVSFTYWQKAQGFDLSEVAALETGCEVRDDQGTPIGSIFVQNRKPVEVEELPEHFVEALVATEDVRFFDHPGYDLRGMARAAVANVRELGIDQGGSTITQQLARHVYSLRGRTFDRKLTEIFLAQRIEEDLGKDQILEHYVNRIYFGTSYWGLGSAARGYFEKEASELDVAESAMLVGIIKRPGTYNPFASPEEALRVRNLTLHRMAEEGFLTAEEAKQYKQEPLGVVDQAERLDRPHYLMTQIRAEAEEFFNKRRLKPEGYVIQTSVNSSLQDQVTNVVSRQLSSIEGRPEYTHQTYAEWQSNQNGSRPSYLQTAVVVIDNRTGQCLAAVGGRDFQDSQFNRAFQARRPPGTAFTPFVYATAFEAADISPITPVMDAAMDNKRVMIGGLKGVLGEWGTENPENHYEGEVAAAYGLLRGKNAMTVRLGNMAGLNQVDALAEAAGVTSPLREFPATFLGSSELTLWELTRAYTTFANMGLEPAKGGLISRIETPDGSAIYESARAGTRARTMSELTAAQVTDIMEASLNAGTARKARSEYGLKTPHAAGKTGTAYGFTDSWFVGFNSEYTCGVWVGFDEPKAIYDEAFSKDIALPVWVEVMNMLEGESPLHAELPNTHSVCLQSGQAATEHCQDQHGRLAARLPLSREFEKLHPCTIHKEGSSEPLIRTDVTIAAVPGAKPVKPRSSVLEGPDPWELLQEAALRTNVTTGSEEEATEEEAPVKADEAEETENSKEARAEEA